MRFPGFIGPSYTLQSVNVDCQRCVNLYPEINALGTGKEKEIAALVSTPGLRLLATIGSGPIRGAWRASNEQLFVVSGSELYRVSSAYAGTLLGTLTTSTGPVSMADNGLVVFVVDGTNGYTWTIASDTFAQVTDPDFYPADQVAFMDGYFIFNKSGSQQFFISELNAVTFDATDIGTAEGSPDYLRGIAVSNQTLFLFGKQSIEAYYDSGATFPFTRIQGAVIETGCIAAFSIAKLDTLYWLGGSETGSGVVYRLQGYKAERVSTPAIESVIRGLDQTTLVNATAWTYQQGGHHFYCLNLPGASSTWVYDASTQLWHERAYLGSFGLERHRAQVHAVAFGLNIVGDYVSGKLYALDPNYYTDGGTAVKRLRASPHLSEGLKYIRHNSFQLDMETGVGLSTGQGSAPLVMMRYSDDGGSSWSSELTASIGAMGNRKTRAIFRRLGSSRDRVYELSVSDPVKVVFIGAELDVEQGVA